MSRLCLPACLLDLAAGLTSPKSFTPAVKRGTPRRHTHGRCWDGAALAVELPGMVDGTVRRSRSSRGPAQLRNVFEIDRQAATKHWRIALAVQSHASCIATGIKLYTAIQARREASDHRQRRLCGSSRRLFAYEDPDLLVADDSLQQVCCQTASMSSSVLRCTCST